jgi:hypothetical protein
MKSREKKIKSWINNLIKRAKSINTYHITAYVSPTSTTKDKIQLNCFHISYKLFL